MTKQSAITKALVSAILHSTEPMVLSDARTFDYPMMAANQAFRDLTGYSQDEIIGRNCRFLQGPGTDSDTARKVGRIIASGHGCVEWLENYRKDGKRFWNLLFISPVHDRDGTLLHFLGNQLDITKGMPDWMGDVVFGRAHMTPAIEAEFHALLLGIVDQDDTGTDPARGARALESIVMDARRLAELSTSLTPGDRSGGG